MLNQPVFRLLALLIVALIKAITAFVGFMLFSFVLLQVGPGASSLPTAVQAFEEAVPILSPALGAAIQVFEDITAEQPVSDESAAESPAASTFETYQDPVGCFAPQAGYDLVEVNGWKLSSRTWEMLNYAQELYGENLELTGSNLIQGSYDDRVQMVDTPFSGGGVVGISLMNSLTGEVLTTDFQGLIRSLRTAGFAAWLRGVEEAYPGSPIMIEAVAVGDQELNEKASAMLFSDYGYFSMGNGLPGGASRADSHGGPVLCRWMLEAGYGGATLEPETAAGIESTFEEENHAALLDPDSVNREARQLRIVPDPLAFLPTGYSGPTSFNCTPPANPSVISGVFGEQRGDFIHAGIDFAQCSRVGFAVYSPMGGLVTFTDYHELYGYTVVVENDGWQVILAHNLADLVAVGDVVEAGQVVALSGSSGNSGGPHIHFEVRSCEDGQCRPVNPSEVLLPGQGDLCLWEDLGQLECPPGL